MKRQAHITKIVERFDQNVKLTDCGKASRMVIPSNRDNVW
jgi:hypothetical protein